MIVASPNEMTLEELKAICDGLGVEFVIEDGGITGVTRKENETK